MKKYMTFRTPKLQMMLSTTSPHIPGHSSRHLLFPSNMHSTMNLVLLMCSHPPPSSPSNVVLSPLTWTDTSLTTQKIIWDKQISCPGWRPFVNVGDHLQRKRKHIWKISLEHASFMLQNPKKGNKAFPRGHRMNCSQYFSNEALRFKTIYLFSDDFNRVENST